jgi:hypothetical protein
LNEHAASISALRKGFIIHLEFLSVFHATRERITFRLTRVNRTTFWLRWHNRTRVDQIDDQHLKERKQSVPKTIQAGRV